MTPEALRARKARIFKNAEKVDKILLVNTESFDPNFLYLTGFVSGLFEYNYLLLDSERAAVITSAMEYQSAKEQAFGGLDVVEVGNIEDMRKYMEKELNGKVLGINGSFMPYQIYEAVKKRYKPKKIVDVSEALGKARQIKDEEEIKSIKNAAGITKWALVLIQKEFKEGITEQALAAKFDSISAEMGSQEPAFRTIVSFGPNAAMPHHMPDDTKLRYGDLIIIDAGAKVRNYCSDMTRTFIFGEKEDRIKDYEKKKEICKIVKQAQVKAIKAVRPGVTSEKIHNIAQRHIDRAAGGAYKGTFIHALGHGLGIKVHDGLGFYPRSKEKIAKDMVVTVEPGIYINGFGGVRIEDDVLVTDDGALVL